MANLIFGGHKIGSASLQFSAARGVLPEIENSTQTIGLTDGETLLNSRLKARIIPVTYDFVALSRREFERQLAPLLYSTDVQKLVIDDRPDEFWLAKVDGKIDMDRAYFLGTGTINFLVPDGVAHSIDVQSFDNKDPKWKDVPLNLLTGTSTPFVVDGTVGNQGWAFREIYDSLVGGQRYVFNADVKLLAGSSDKIKIAGFDGDNTVSPDVYMDIVNGHISGTFTGVNGNNRLIIYAGTDGTTAGKKAQFTNQKLEVAVPDPQYAQVPINLVTGTRSEPVTVTGDLWAQKNLGDFNDLIVGKTYTASASIGNADHNINLECYAIKGDGSRIKSMGYVTISPNSRKSVQFDWVDLSQSGAVGVRLNTAWTNDKDAGSYQVSKVKLEEGSTASPWSPNPADIAYYKPSTWSPNPADGEYYLDQITVHNDGTYPVNPIITATMHGDNGMVGFVNDQAGVLQFGTEEIDGYQTDESEKGLNGDFSREIAGTIYNQSATNNPNWGGSSATPNKQTGSVKYVNDGYNGWHVEPVYAATGDYWNGPALKVPIAPTKLNTRNNNFTFTAMLRFETSVSQLGRMELTLESKGVVQYQAVITDNNAVKDELQLQCYVKNQFVGTQSLNRSQFTNDKFIQVRINKFGSTISFEASPWNGRTGRESTVALPPLTFTNMIGQDVDAFSTWFERNKSWGESNMKLIAAQFDWQHVNWWTDIKNRFGKDDVLTIDVARNKIYLNGVEDRTLHTLGNMWDKFILPVGESTIKIVPSSWAKMFDTKVEFREAWL